jgi:hypothetical protein
MPSPGVPFDGGEAAPSPLARALVGGHRERQAHRTGPPAARRGARDGALYSALSASQGETRTAARAGMSPANSEVAAHETSARAAPPGGR